MKAAILFATLILTAAAVTGCDSSPLLRDRYMGQWLLEPRLLPRPVPRDGQGHPLLQPQDNEENEFWPRLFDG